MLPRLAFIGSGKMAEALIQGVKSNASRIIASDVNKKRLAFIKKKYRVRVTASNSEAVRNAEIIILAIKPQNMAEILREIHGLRRQLVISIAAGIPLRYLQKKTPGVPIVRAMPNNPCLVKEGITALARGKNTTPAQFNKAVAIFKTVGKVVAVPESYLDAVTGLSGSGPAFVYEVIEALTDGGVRSGLPKKLALKLALQTVKGAVKTVEVTGKSPRKLQEMVTSPGGTTIEGLKVLKKFQTSKALASAVIAAARKSKKLSKTRAS